jgi:malonyl-CoA O-methyltransferase
MHELDQKLLRRDCNRVAPAYASHDFFCTEIRGRLLERLSLTKLDPGHILELGSGTGASGKSLHGLYPDARIIELDWAENMLRTAAHGDRLCADAHFLPIRDHSIDIIFSNLMLPGCAEPERIFQEARRTLKHPGLFLFSTLGPDTLKELRRAWDKVDNTPHVHTFADMHNIGDALVQAGFREPVMDVEHITITYAEVDKLVHDLRNIGATNRLLSRRRGLTTPGLWKHLLTELETRRNATGRLAISLEVITGQAWTGEPPRGVQMQDGEAAFPLSQLQGREQKS